MPTGELFLKTRKTNGYVDAYVRYGLSLEDGAMSQLITPAPNKRPVGNSNAVSSGVSYLAGSVGVKDERMLSLEMHICAKTRADFFSRLNLFSSEILDLAAGDHIRTKTSYTGNTVRHFIYQDFKQFTEFNLEMAKFLFTVLEPHPEVTTDI